MNRQGQVRLPEPRIAHQAGGAATVALIAALALPAAGLAQDITARRGDVDLKIPPPVPVTVALVDELPDLGEPFDAVVMRRSKGLGGDVILISREQATVRALDTAMRILLDSRMVMGVELREYRGKPFEEMMFGVIGNEPAEEAWLIQYRGKIQAVLDRLEDADERNIRGIGRVQAMTVRPPELTQWLVRRRPPGARKPGGGG